MSMHALARWILASGAAGLLILAPAASVSGTAAETGASKPEPAVVEAAVPRSRALEIIGNPDSEYYSASGEGRFMPDGQLVGGR